MTKQQSVMIFGKSISIKWRKVEWLCTSSVLRGLRSPFFVYDPERPHFAVEMLSLYRPPSHMHSVSQSVLNVIMSDGTAIFCVIPPGGDEEEHLIILVTLPVSLLVFLPFP